MVGVVLEKLRKVYFGLRGEERVALEEVDLEIAPGEFVAFLGPSGCGKTTLLNLIGGVDSSYQGRIRFLGARIPPKIGYVFQEPRLLPWSKAWENLTFVLREGDREAKDRAHAWLARLGLEEYAETYPSQLSLGQQQRVAIARALIVEPEILLMDEPTSALDELTAMSLREELLSLWENLGCTVLYVTHNPLEAAYLADRVVLMTPRPGRIAQIVDLKALLGRRRNPDDPKLWEVSRSLVRKLKDVKSFV